MRVFLTGAAGFVGAPVVAELLAAGHQPVGLARSDETVTRLAEMGATAHRGALEDLASLRRGAETADAVIHLAFNGDFTKFAENCEIDRLAIEAIGEVLSGSDRKLIVPNGLAGLSAPGRILLESDDVPPSYRFPRASEQTALAWAAKGVNACVVRLPQVHDTKRQGLVTRLVETARRTGVSAYVGDGRNRWAAAHISDVARLFPLVLASGERGAKYHAVAEAGVELRDIAEEIGRVLAVPVKSLTPDEARAPFGPISLFVAVDMAASAEATQAKFDWRPKGPGLIEDLAA